MCFLESDKDFVNRDSERVTRGGKRGLENVPMQTLHVEVLSILHRLRSPPTVLTCGTKMYRHLESEQWRCALTIT